MKLKTKFKQLALVILSVTIIGISFPNISFAKEINSNDLITLTNQERSKNNISTLQENSLLDQAASLKAEHMLKNGYFAHNAPTGETSWYWFDKVNYNYHYAGENLAISYYNPKELMNDWMNSPTHRANILNPNFQDIGMAVVYGNYRGGDTIIIVQMFGKLMDSQMYNTVPENIKGNNINKGENVKSKIIKILKVLGVLKMIIV